MGSLQRISPATQLFINAVEHHFFSVKGTPSENEIILQDKKSPLGDVKITFDDMDLDNEVEPKSELKIEIQGTVLPIKDIPRETWSALLPLLKFKPKEISLTTVSKHFLGIPLSTIEERAKENFKRLTEEANQLAKKIDSTSSSWQETMKTLQKQKIQSIADVVKQYTQAVPEGLDYMKRKQWIDSESKPIDIFEDTDPRNTIALVSGLDGSIYIGTKNPESEVFYPFMTKAIALHESVHSLDFQANFMTENPLTEGIAYFLEKKAYEDGDYYTTDAERLGAVHLQLLRNAVVIKNAALERGEITHEQVADFYTNDLLISKKAATEIAREPSELPNPASGFVKNPSPALRLLKKLSYVGGSDAIEELWQVVKKKKPELAFKDFITTLLKQGPYDDPRIQSIAKKEFGLDFNPSD